MMAVASPPGSLSSKNLASVQSVRTRRALEEALSLRESRRNDCLDGHYSKNQNTEVLEQQSPFRPNLRKA